MISAMTWPFFCACMGSLLAFGVAFAHDAGSANAAWFNSLRQSSSNASCCGPADCLPIDDWNIDLKDGVYWVRDPRDSQWLKVPMEAIQERSDNPTGKYVACINFNMAQPTVICFIRGPRS